MNSLKETIDIYAMLMQEAVVRLNQPHIAADFGIAHPSVIHYETCQLQIRMLCEVIAVACLSLHQDIPKLETDIRNKYNAQYIINRLSREHQDFFPAAVDRIKDESLPGNRYILKEKSGEFMTKTELLRAYDNCGKFLHRQSINRLKQKPNIDLDFVHVREWCNKLSGLLQPHHNVKIANEGGYITCTIINDGKTIGVQVIRIDGLKPNQYIQLKF